MRIGAKVNIFNAKMRDARNAKNMTQAELAYMVGENVGTIQLIEQLKQPPVRIDRIKDILYGISDILGVDFDILFPSDYLFALQNKYLPRERNLVLFRDVDILSLPADNNFLQLPAPDKIVEDEQMKVKVRQLIKILPEREGGMLAFYYGLHDGEKHTFEETGKQFQVTTKRAHEVVEMALFKMRGNKECKKLRDFLY